MIGKDTKSTVNGENEGSLSRLCFSPSFPHLLGVMSIQILGNLHASLSRLHSCPPVKALVVPAIVKWPRVLVVLFYTISTFWPTLFLFKSQFQPESLCKSITNPALLRCSLKPASPNNTLFYGSSLIPSHHKNPCVLSTALKSDPET